MKNPLLKKMVEMIGYREGLPVVVDPGILDPKQFIDEVVTKRIPNPFMPDTPQRIATDTSQKLPIRFGDHSPAVGTFYEKGPNMKEKSFEPGRDNIVLIGMPGAGKSTLGIVLAKILCMDFVDADLLIQQSCDKSLQRLIDTLGPDAFLEIENQVLSEMSFEHSVIATGGSAIYSEPAMKHLSEIGRVVYLKISFDELKCRLADFSERGVVMRDGIGMSLRELYDERLPLYEKYADITVDVNDLSITAAARKVAAALK